MPLKYVFSANPGRSGSKYLAKIFEGHPQVAAFHEGKPVLNGIPMRQWLGGNPVPMQQAIPGKLTAIQQGLTGKILYLETNHCFITGFGFELMQHLPQEEVAVLVLQRTPAEVANSYYRMGVSPLNKRGTDWLITPAATGTWIMDPAALKKFHKLQSTDSIFSGINRKLGKLLPDPLKTYKLDLLQQYVYHVQALTKQFFETYPNVKRIDFTLEQLNYAKGLSNLCAMLGVDFTAKMDDRVGRKVNKRG